MLKTTDERWDPWRLVIMVQIMLFLMHDRAGKVWDP